MNIVYSIYSIYIYIIVYIKVYVIYKYMYNSIYNSIYDLAIHKRCTLGQVSRELPSANIYPAVTQTISKCLSPFRPVEIDMILAEPGHLV